MSLLKLAISPGIQRDSTRYSSVGSWIWYDCNNVRFHHGFPERIGGWVKYSDTQHLGVCRSMIAWADLESNPYLGFGTNLKYYIDTGGTLFDVTPIRVSEALTDPFTTTIGSATVTVDDTSHGARLGDFVTFSGATAVGGLTIDGEYQIQSIIDGNSYTITAASTASSSAGPGGGSVTAEYQINTGSDTTLYGAGWGAGPWGGDYPTGPDTGWGDAAILSIASDLLRIWSNDTFGQDLVINPRNGAIYYWVNASGVATRAVLLSSLVGAADVPAVSRQIITTSDEKIIAFGCTDYTSGIQDKMLIRWSDTSNPHIWTPLETNAAGGIRIPIGSEFISAVETKSETLVWSDAALHSLQYIGGNLQYGITAIGITTIAGPRSNVSTDDSVFWMGNSAFYRYNGRINVIPCPISDYIFNNLNWLQAEKITSGSNTGYNEIWWFYPSLGSDENDRYVIYNYLENVWSYGDLARTCWIESGIEDYPRAASPDGYIYYHEYGIDDGSTNPASPVNGYIESGIIELGEGDNFFYANRVLPDITFKNSTAATPTITMTFKAQNYPGSSFAQQAPESVQRTSTVTIEQFTAQKSFRLRGRELTYRVESNAVGVTWRIGISRIEIRPDGGR